MHTRTQNFFRIEFFYGNCDTVCRALTMGENIMNNTKNISLLAPYGSMKFLALSTKIAGKVPSG